MSFVLVGAGGGPGTGQTTIVESEVKPSWYFQSEVFGHPDEARTALDVYNRELVIDIGGPRGGVFVEDVTVTCEIYSPNAVRNVDYEFPDFPGTSTVQVTIPAYQQQARIAIRALPAGLATTQKWFVVEMATTTHGEIGSWVPSRHNRWTGILLGAQDVEGLIPPMPIPSTDDYRVYADRVEDLVHGITIPLPFDPDSWTGQLRTDMESAYGAIDPPPGEHWRTTLFSSMSGGNADDKLNGPCIAGLLAQKVWLDRNGGSFGVSVKRDGSPITDDSQMYNWGAKFIPAVKWLDVGVEVVVRVMEQPASAEPPTVTFGGAKTPSTASPVEIRWGNHSVHGVNAQNGRDIQWGPGATRDLWIVSDDPSIELGGVGVSHKRHQEIASFIDNVHVVGFTMRCKSELRDCIGTNGISNNTAEQQTLGLLCFDGIVFADPQLSPPNAGNFKQQFRFNGQCSFDIRNCVAGESQEHFCYVDQSGPLVRQHANVHPIGRSGRSRMIQHVQRPWEAVEIGGGGAGRGGGPGHGLMALVDLTAFGPETEFFGTGAPDVSIHGFSGYIFIVDTHHLGALRRDGQNSPRMNRRPIGIVMTGGPDGAYVTEDLRPGYEPVADAPYNTFGVRYCWIDKLDINLDQFAPDNSPYQWDAAGNGLNGCEFIEIGTVTRYTGPNLGQRPAWEFNASAVAKIETTLGTDPQGNPEVQNGGVMADPLNRLIAGGGPLPGGPERGLGSGVRIPNKGGVQGGEPGGVRFVAGVFDSILGPLTSTPLGPQQGSGSTRLARHVTFAQAFDPNAPGGRVDFSNLPESVRNAYTGTDPIP